MDFSLREAFINQKHRKGLPDFSAACRVELAFTG
jgi:hypothetical protein